jgi:hypothetical protein
MNVLELTAIVLTVAGLYVTLFSPSATQWRFFSILVQGLTVPQVVRHALKSSVIKGIHKP